MVTKTQNGFLELRNVRVEFDRRVALRGMSLHVMKQEIVGIIGPNGAGKTTLFNVICGQVKPTDGAIHFNNEDITRWPPHRICHAGVARTFQIAKPFPEMSVQQNVLVGLWFGSKKQYGSLTEQAEAEELLELVHLSAKSKLPAKDLTLSEQRRLEIARALATSPQFLLLDEVAAGLSPHAIKEMAELIKTLRHQGLTLLLTDHFLTLTSKVSDRLVALDQGEIIMEGKPGEVLQSAEVASAYLGERPTRNL
ncbi:MAG: ABC transporter ATP-binding protein [Desulfoferrobacter sp.]